jgi:hypothetical protein
MEMENNGKSKPAGVGRGGTRRGAGKKRKPIEEKLLSGSEKRPIEVLSFANDSELITAEASLPHEFLGVDQLNEFDGSKEQTYAKKVYDETYGWMKERRVAHLVPKLLLERYASECANWIYCYMLTRKKGNFVINKRREMPEVSPWARQMLEYGARSDALWNQIYLTVRDNSVVKYEGDSPHSDILAEIIDW